MATYDFYIFLESGVGRNLFLATRGYSIVISGRKQYSLLPLKTQAPPEKNGCMTHTHQVVRKSVFVHCHLILNLYHDAFGF